MNQVAEQSNDGLLLRRRKPWPQLLGRQRDQHRRSRRGGTLAFDMT